MVTRQAQELQVALLRDAHGAPLPVIPGLSARAPGLAYLPQTAMLHHKQLCVAVVAALLSWPAAAPPAALNTSLQFFGWWAWGSKHLPGQTVPTAAHANFAVDESLDYLLGQPLPALLALHPPRRSDNKSIFTHGSPAADPNDRVGFEFHIPTCNAGDLPDKYYATDGTSSGSTGRLPGGLKSCFYEKHPHNQAKVQVNGEKQRK